MLHIGVPFGAVQQKMSVDGASEHQNVQSVLSRHTIDALTRGQSILHTNQEPTVDFSMLPSAILIAGSTSMCIDCVEIKELAQKIRRELLDIFWMRLKDFRMRAAIHLKSTWLALFQSRKMIHLFLLLYRKRERKYRSKRKQRR